MATEAHGATIALRQIDLKIHPGEIVGVAGVSGNGQRELGDLILGDLACTRGSKWLYGKDVTHAAIGEMRRHGVAFIPEDPLTMASVPMLSVLENIAVTRTDRYARDGGLRMDWRAVRLDAEDAMQQLGFLLLARWAGPVAVRREPAAHGHCAGALSRSTVDHRLLHYARARCAERARRAAGVAPGPRRGAAVLLISEDLEEIFLLSDRLVVLYARPDRGSISDLKRPERSRSDGS